MVRAALLVDDADRRFIRNTMSAEMLSREEELHLARQWREDQNQTALDRLIHAYLRLVVSAATKFRHYGLPMSDMMQEGVVGLMQAAARFEPSREIRFSTYATWWIRSAMQEYVLRNWSIVRTGTTAAQKSLFFNLRRLKARIEERGHFNLDDDSRKEIATELDVSVKEVELMEARLFSSDQSLNAPVGTESEYNMQDFLADDRPGPEDVVNTQNEKQAKTKWIANALDLLNPRERHIITARRLKEEGRTLEDLGRELGISKERVRQIEHRALEKMRSSLSEQMTSGFQATPAAA